MGTQGLSYTACRNNTRVRRRGRCWTSRDALCLANFCRDGTSFTLFTGSSTKFVLICINGARRTLIVGNDGFEFARHTIFTGIMGTQGLSYTACRNNTRVRRRGRCWTSRDALCLTSIDCCFTGTTIQTMDSSNTFHVLTHLAIQTSFATSHRLKSAFATCFAHF